MNIQIEKDFIIERLKSINDVDLLRAIKSLLNYGLKKEEESKEIAIPEWHKEIVNKRLMQARANPENLLSWEDIMKELDS